MGRAPCCDKTKVKRGPWSPEEDTTIKNYVEKYGTGGSWIALPHKAGLKRCGKSCRLRWLNYLRPGIEHGDFTEEEDNIILTLYSNIGSRWSVIASHLPGRTDNGVKNYWNTKLKKKLLARATGVVNATIPTPIIPINNRNSNNFATDPRDLSLATSVAPLNKVHPNYYEYSANYPIMSSDTLPYSDVLIQGYPEIVPDLLYNSSTTVPEFPLPGFMEVQENGMPQNGFTTSSSSPQEISSLSPSHSLAKSYASWHDNGVGEEVGFFMELESKTSYYDLHQEIHEQNVMSAEVDDASLVNYSYHASSLLANNISDNVPSQGLYHSSSS